MTPQKIVDLANDWITKRTVNRYDHHVPYGDMMAALERLGLVPPDPDEVPFALLGHKGNASILLVHPDHPKSEFYLHVSWYRMRSGNFETVAYVQTLKTSNKRPPLPKR
jgi:hypothetical protein